MKETEFKVKTLEEIRAEKLAKTRSPSKQEVIIETNASPPPATKRSAQQNNRHIKIKRPKLTSDTATTQAQPVVQVKPHAPVVKNMDPQQVIKAAKPEDDSIVEEEYFVEEEEDDGTGTSGAEALNDDELLLEIDNILGH